MTMKRRNFLLATTGIAGGIVAPQARAAQPCPPPLVIAPASSIASATCGVAAGDSALRNLATSMSAGAWANFSMGLTSATFTGVAPGGSEPSINNGFGNRMLWDPVHRKLQYAGTTHTGGATVSGAGGLATWDEKTNTWSRETYAWSSENPGHSYSHIAVNTTNGDLYFRSFNSRTIYRRVYGQTGQASWQAFSALNGITNWANQVAGALEWFPELNGGAGGLAFADELGASRSDATLKSWTGQSSISKSGPYHNWCARAGGLFYFGGGNGSSAMYAMNAGGTVSAKASTPLSAGSAGASMVFAHPNGTDLLLFQNSASGAIHRFNGTSWSNAGTHQIGVSDGLWMACAIPEYGVMVFIRNERGSGTPTCVLYKPA
jgi:hypothetical protein